MHPVRISGEPQVLELEVRQEAGSLRRARLRAIGVHIPTLLDELDEGKGPALTALRGQVEELFAETEANIKA